MPDPRDAPGRPVLEFRDLRKVFRSGWNRRTVALDGVSFEVREGETFALLGKNGAGKSTLFKIALGLLRPTSGSGAAHGVAFGDLRARAAIGFQPEQPYLYPFLTVGETLRLLADLGGVPGSRTRAEIERVAKACGLEEKLGAPVRRLSRGWLQRVALAGALIGDPPLLLLDEPMSGLDPEARLALKQLLRRARARGKAVVFSTHILPDVEQLADRLAILRQGRLLACGSMDQLLGAESGGHVIELRRAPGAAPDACRLPDGTPVAGGERIRQDDASGRVWLRLSAMEPAAMQRLLAHWIASGVEIVSLSPCRETLEEFYARLTATDAARAGCASRAPRRGEDGEGASFAA